MFSEPLKNVAKSLKFSNLIIILWGIYILMEKILYYLISKMFVTAIIIKIKNNIAV